MEHNKKTKNKATLVDEVRRLIRASVGNRAKESLVVDFINQANLDEIPDKASVIEAFFTFARAEQQREAVELIADENLNTEAANRYISTSLKREFASENGTELNSVLPKMSPLNPAYLTKKQSVFQKIAAFVEKFKGVGGRGLVVQSLCAIDVEFSMIANGNQSNHQRNVKSVVSVGQT